MSVSFLPSPGKLARPGSSPQEAGFTPEEVQSVLAQYYLRADRFTKIALGFHFCLALVLAGFYDTWLVTIPVALAASGVFFCSSALRPGSFLTRCTAGLSLAIFVTLHVYQMHGLPEMHFLFFTTLTIMIAYCDWKAMWPATIYIILQHVSFAYLTNLGAQVYFFPESYVDTTKLVFHFGFAAGQAVICGVWAYSLRQQILRDAREYGDKVRRLGLVAEKTQNAVVVTDARGIITWVNESFTKVTGYTAAEAVNTLKGTLLHGPGTDPQTVERIREAIRSGGPFQGEIYNYKKDGRGYWLSLSLTPLKTEANQLEGFIAIETDLTELKQAAEAIRLREERFDLAFKGSSEGLWDWNILTNEIYYSPRYKQLLGYEDEEYQLNYEIWKSSIHPDDSECVARVLQTHLDGGGVYDAEYRMRMKSDAYCWFRVRGEAKRDATGTAIRMAGSLCDISNHKRTEGALLSYVQDVDDARKKIQEQTWQLINQTEELRLTQLRAEAANSAKSDFLANMSHEIRTPMSAIIGHSELLLDSRQTTSQRHQTVQSIQRNGEHLLQLVNDILDLSKIEAGKMELELIVCSPCQIVADVASMMRVRTNAKDLAFEVEYVGRVPETIQSDPTRIRQILVNLVANAIKFTAHGSIRVACRFDRETDPSQPKLRFDVIDTGVGMTAKQVERLFQPFVQADSSTTRKFGGTGLGLTISKRLAQMLGGDLTVQTEVGYGSRFSATIAVGSLTGVKLIDGMQEAGLIPTEAAAAALEDNEFAALEGCRVLLAEDGEDNQYLISLHLNHAGVEVEVAPNGRLAVEKVLATRRTKQNFDVILMDMQMPEMDGYAATAELRRAGYRGPIVALTAHAMSGDREKCLAAGCDDYCTKPISRPRLLSMVAKFVGRDQAGVSSAVWDAPEVVAEPKSALVNNESGMQQLVDRYVGRLQIYAGQFEQLLATRDLSALKRLAHQVRGSAGGYGFQAISELAANLENALINDADSRSLATAVSELVEGCRLTRAGVDLETAIS